MLKRLLKSRRKVLNSGAVNSYDYRLLEPLHKKISNIGKASDEIQYKYTEYPECRLKQLQQLTEGFIYSHKRINDNTKKSIEVSSFAYALIEILTEKGIITIEEIDERKKDVAERQIKRFTESGLGLLYQDPEFDKYTFEKEADVDCQSCLNTCKAVGCKFPFALSRQDVEEGIIR
jgi:hypothetical protein